MTKLFLSAWILLSVSGTSMAQNEGRFFSSEFDREVSREPSSIFYSGQQLRFHGKVKTFVCAVDCYFIPYVYETFFMDCNLKYIMHYDRGGNLVSYSAMWYEKKDTLTDEPNEVVMDKDDFLVKTVFEFPHNVDKEIINGWVDPVVYDKSIWTDTYNENHQLARHSTVLYHANKYVADYDCSYTYNNDGRLLTAERRGNINGKTTRCVKNIPTLNNQREVIKAACLDSTVKGTDIYYGFYFYDSRGNLIETYGENSDGMTKENSKQTYQYDSLNRLVYSQEGQHIKCIYYPDEGGEIDTIYDVRYDDKGMHKKEEYCYIDCKNKYGDIVKILFKRKGEKAILCEYNEYEYDNMGNVVTRRNFIIKGKEQPFCRKEIHLQYEYYK